MSPDRTLIEEVAEALRNLIGPGTWADKPAALAVEVVARRLGCSVEELEGMRLREERQDQEHEFLAGYVSREMATDACEPMLEGQPIYADETITMGRFVSDWKPVAGGDHA